MADKNLPVGVVFVPLNNAVSEFQGKFTPNVSKMGLVKRGDYVKILLKFPEYPKESGNVHEFITCQISSVSPNGFLRIRIASHPQFQGAHGLRYGDDIVIQQAHVLEHDPVTSEVAKATEHMLVDMPPLAPEAGKEYWTRNGDTARIWTLMQDQNGQYWLGEVKGRFTDVQWFTDGRNRQGDKSLDVVKDPTVSDATLYEDVKV